MGGNDAKRELRKGRLELCGRYLSDGIQYGPGKRRCRRYTSKRFYEIASLLHILEATVRTRLSRARKLLKIQLDDQTKERRAVNEQNKRL